MFCYSTVCVKVSDSDSQKPARKSTFFFWATDQILWEAFQGVSELAFFAQNRRLFTRLDCQKHR